MAKVFTSLEEYYEMYLADIDIVLDGDLSYPQNISLTELLHYEDTTP